MRLLFLGYDDNQLKVMNIIKKNYIIDAVGYENSKVPLHVSIKNIDEINLYNYKIIFISELLSSNYDKLFRDYNGECLIFKGLSKIKLSELKNEFKVNYLINELKHKQNISRPNVFICGYDNLGLMLSKRLLSMGINLRAGVTCWDEIFDLLHQKISCIYTNNNNTLISFVESDEFIINTMPIEFNSNVTEKIKDYLIDINDYDAKENNHQKVYVPK